VSHAIVGFARQRPDSYREHAIEKPQERFQPNTPLQIPVHAKCGQICRWAWDVPFIPDVENGSCPTCIFIEVIKA